MKKLYLNEILIRDKVEYNKNNLIVSPSGSGKTDFIMNTLMGMYDGNKLLLVPMNDLKLINRNQVERKRMLNITDDSIHVMTYLEFGEMTLRNNNSLLDYVLIVCDEIHSLFEYYLENKIPQYDSAIKSIFSEYKNPDTFSFTTTLIKIELFMRDESNYFLYGDNVKLVDYNEDVDIKRYYNHIEKSFDNIDGIEDAVLNYLGELNLDKPKGVIFNEINENMSDVISLLEYSDFRTISIMMSDDKENIMNEEQLRVKSFIIEERMIPEGYDFIIMNGKVGGEWKLIDDKLDFVIINSLEKDSKLLTRGRIKKDIEFLALKKEIAGDEMNFSFRDFELEFRYKTGNIERYRSDFMIDDVHHIFYTVMLVFGGDDLFGFGDKVKFDYGDNEITIDVNELSGFKFIDNSGMKRCRILNYEKDSIDRPNSLEITLNDY